MSENSDISSRPLRFFIGPPLHATTRHEQGGGAAPQYQAGRRLGVMSIRRRQQAAMRTMAVLASLALTGAGLTMTFSLVHTPASFAREGPGRALIFDGTVVSAAAAA